MVPAGKTSVQYDRQLHTEQGQGLARDSGTGPV